MALYACVTLAGYSAMGMAGMIGTAININRIKLFPYKNKNIKIEKENNVKLLELYKEKTDSPTYIGNQYVKIPVEGSTYLEKLASIAKTEQNTYFNCFIKDHNIKIPVMPFNKEKIDDYLKQYDQNNILKTVIETNCDKKLVMAYSDIPICYIGKHKSNTFIGRDLSSIAIDLACSIRLPLTFFSGLSSFLIYLFYV